MVEHGVEQARRVATMGLMALALGCGPAPAPPRTPASTAPTEAPEITLAGTRASFPEVTFTRRATERAWEPLADAVTRTVWRAETRRPGGDVDVCQREDGSWRMSVGSFDRRTHQPFSDVLSYPSLTPQVTGAPFPRLGSSDGDTPYVCAQQTRRRVDGDLVMVDEDTGQTLGPATPATPSEYVAPTLRWLVPREEGWPDLRDAEGFVHALPDDAFPGGKQAWGLLTRVEEDGEARLHFVRRGDGHDRTLIWNPRERTIVAVEEYAATEQTAADPTRPWQLGEALVARYWDEPRDRFLRQEEGPLLWYRREHQPGDVRFGLVHLPHGVELRRYDLSSATYELLDTLTPEACAGEIFTGHTRYHDEAWTRWVAVSCAAVDGPHPTHQWTQVYDLAEDRVWRTPHLVHHVLPGGVFLHSDTRAYTSYVPFSTLWETTARR